MNCFISYPQNNIRDKLSPITVDLVYRLNEENTILVSPQLMPILDDNIPELVRKQVRINQFYFYSMTGLSM